MSVAHADRNLLFGVLALQMDFIGRDALIAALNSWVLEKSKPLGQVLLEQQALSREEHAALSAVVQKHIERHGGDARESLVALVSLGGMPFDLEEVANGDVRDSLMHLGEVCPSLPLASTLAAKDWQSSADERFQILRPHASGGLGEVFVAQDHQLNRHVALKRIHRRHTESSDNRARFRLEAEITGGLEHPGIVPVYGMGTTADGRTYYAMRLIRGETLKDAIARFHSAASRNDGGCRLELRQLLGRFIDVCNAVAYAHSRGVIHRDLKPSNIMLGKYGETLVVDWGLVKAVGRGGEAASMDELTLIPSSGRQSSETLPGSALGTPAYMSPEQAAGRTGDVSPSSDIYSLGATLYSLLTGKEAFEAAEVGKVLEQVRKGQFVPPRERNRSVPLPLDAICLKTMRLTPDERYPSCAALASDIERWLADEPVTCFREPLTARSARWVKRHRGLAATVSTILVALFVGLIVTTAILKRSNTQIAAEAHLAIRQSYIAQVNLAQRALAENNAGHARELLENVVPELTLSLDLRGIEWHYLWRLTHSERNILPLRSTRLAFTPDGQFLISDHPWNGSLKMCSADGTREIWTIKAHERRINGLAISGDSRLVATRGNDGAVKLWTVATGEFVSDFPGSLDLYSGLAISPDGQRLAIASGNIVEIWDTKSHKEIGPPLKGHSGHIDGLAFFPDGQRLASGSRDSTVRVWDLSNGKEIQLPGVQASVRSVAVSPNGRFVAAGGSDGSLKCWDVDAELEVAPFEGHGNAINAVEFFADGYRLASASSDTTLKLWNTATGQMLQTLRGHEAGLTDVAIALSGNVIATGSWDETIRLWDAASRQEPWSQRHPCGVSSVTYSSDGTRLAIGGDGNVAVFDSSIGLKLWSKADSLTSRIWPEKQAIRNISLSRALHFDPQRNVLALALNNGTLLLRDAQSGRELGKVEEAHNGPVTCLDYSPDGSLLATGGKDRLVALWNLDGGLNTEVKLSGHLSAVTSVEFSPDGKYLLSAASEDDEIRLWDIAKRQVIRTIDDDGQVLCLVFGRDGSHFFTGGSDGMIRMWDLNSGQMIRVHRAHTGDVKCLSISRDGRRLASCSTDHTVRLWDAQSGQELQTYSPGIDDLSDGDPRWSGKNRIGSPRAFISVDISPDGTGIAAGLESRRVIVWDARPLTDELRAQLTSPDLQARIAAGELVE